MSAGTTTLAGAHTGPQPAAVIPSRWEHALAVLVFAATAMVMTAPGWMPGQAMGGFDIWAFSTPYRETTPTQVPVDNPLQTDLLEQVPIVAEFWTAARAGDLQLWEPDHGAGMPLLTAVHTRVLAPPNLAYAVVPPWRAAGAAVAVTLFLAQLGAYLLGRRLGLGLVGGVLGGVAYGLSGPVTSLLLRIHETAMLPWVLLGVHACVAGRRRRTLPLTALAVAGTLLSGFPAAALHVLYFAAGLGVWLVVDTWRRRGRAAALTGLARAVSATIGGVLVTAPVLLPSFEWLTQTGSIERSFPITHALGLDRLATAVSGRFFGAFQDGDFWLESTALTNPVEASMTMGLVVLLLLLRLVWSPPSTSSLDRSLAGYLVPGALVALVAVVIGGPVLGLIHQLPYMDSNAFGRARFIVSLVVALMAGAALDDVVGRVVSPATVRPPHRGAQRLRGGWLRWGSAGVLGMVGVGTCLAATRAVARGQVSEVAVDLVVPTICAVVAVGSWLLLRRRRGRAAGAGVALVAVVALAVELQVGAWGFVSTAPRSLFYPDPQLPAALVADVGPGGPHRFMGTSLNVLPPHAPGLLDLTDLRISFPAHQPWRELLEVADPGTFERRRLRTVFTDRMDWDSPVLDRLATRWVVQPLRDPLLQVADATVTSDTDDRLRWTLPALGAPVRAVTVPVDPGDCTEGWVELRMDGELVTRRLAREVRGTVTFPVPDLDAPGAAFDMTATHCDLALGPVQVGYQVAAGGLRVVSTDRLVIYERPATRPRAEVVSDVVVASSPAETLATVGAVPSTTAVVTENLSLDPGAGGTARLRHDDPDEVTVTARADGRALLVLRDVAAPGWRAWLDGEEVDVVTVDHALRGVVLPPGEHEVAFRYRPRSVRTGLWLAVLGAVVLCGGLALGGRRPAPAAEPAEG